MNHNPADNENTVCDTCHLDIKNMKVPKACLENGFKYAEIPECLSKKD